MKNNKMKNEELRMKNVFYSAHEISYFHSSFFILHLIGNAYCLPDSIKRANQRFILSDAMYGKHVEDDAHNREQSHE